MWIAAFTQVAFATRIRTPAGDPIQPWQPVMNLKRTLFAVTFIYVVLLAGAAVWSWNFASNGEEFVKLFAAWIAALTSALGAAVSVTVMFSQQKANTQLEQLKGEISKSVKAVEFGMGQTAKAVEAVSTATSNYYYSLATLEHGSFEEGDVKAADRSMRQARARLIDLLPTAQLAFDAFWQVGSNVEGELRKLAPLTGKQEAMKKVWRDYVEEFGGRLQEAENALRESQRTARGDNA